MLNNLPVLDYPDFLSVSIDTYLKQTADHATRNIVFVDKTKMGIIFWVKAAVVTFADRCDVLLAVDPNEINREAYQAERDDPILAHEITHLQLFHEGWARLQGRDLDQRSKDKLRMVENFLTDPLVNQKITKQGFSPKPYLLDQAETFIRDLRTGSDLAQLTTLALSAPMLNNTLSQAEMADVTEMMFRNSHIEPIGRFMSLYLDTEISEATRLSLYEAFRIGLPALFEVVCTLIKGIEDNGFDSSSRYRQAALACLNAWGVDTQQVQFIQFKECTNDGTE